MVELSHCSVVLSARETVALLVRSTVNEDLPVPKFVLLWNRATPKCRLLSLYLWERDQKLQFRSDTVATSCHCCIVRTVILHSYFSAALVHSVGRAATDQIPKLALFPLTHCAKRTEAERSKKTVRRAKLCNPFLTGAVSNFYVIQSSRPYKLDAIQISRPYELDNGLLDKTDVSSIISRERVSEERNAVQCSRHHP